MELPTPYVSHTIAIRGNHSSVLCNNFLALTASTVVGLDHLDPRLLCLANCNVENALVIVRLSVRAAHGLILPVAVLGAGRH